MNSNIIKRNNTKSDEKILYNLFSPTELYIGNTIHGNCIGYKKYLILKGNNPQYQSPVVLNADGEIISIDLVLKGFENEADCTCGDSLYVDDTKGKVYHYTNVYELELKKFTSYISVNKIYDTHSTFQMYTYAIPGNVEKKKGLSNLYSSAFITHRQSSPSIYDSGIVGAEISGYIYFKMEADDESYFYNGERITDISQFRNWITENDVRILYERSVPLVTDITDTELGKRLLDLCPENNFSWSIEGSLCELCVYRNIDDVLTEIKSMIIE